MPFTYDVINFKILVVDDETLKEILMSEQLPISIYPNAELAKEFDMINSVTNKLEAQFNFQTMTANWYGDEEDILFVQLHIGTPQSFTEKKNVQQEGEINIFSDDVFSFYEKGDTAQVLVCHMAITQSELTLLTQKNQLLAALLKAKLQKVLNLIAEQLSLPSI